ncbi:MAG: SLBB domain-containing protein [Calditrichaeota bacterium]|nr:SLBB domain-containing protein [Calditrichota bacterium]
MIKHYFFHIKANRSSTIRQVSLFIVLFAFVSVTIAAPPRRIQIGDAVSITVSDHPEFSQKALVFQDGTTDYPLLAGIPIYGLTASEVKALLKPVMLRYDLEPEIFIIITQARSIGFQVYGEIHQPGQYTVQGSLNLQHAIAIAGGPTDRGDYRRVRIFRNAENKREVIDIDFEDFFHTDSLFIAPEIQPGDVIVIPRLEWRDNIRILGHVGKPGTYILSPDDNILDVVQKAGGLLENCDQKRIIHIVMQNGRTERHLVDLDQLIKRSDYLNIPLVNPGDVIIVQEIKEWRSYWYWVENLRELLWLVSAVLLLSDRY